MARRTKALGPIVVALFAVALLAPALSNGQDVVAGPLAPVLRRGSGAGADPTPVQLEIAERASTGAASSSTAPGGAPAARSPGAGAADPTPSPPEPPEASAADEPPTPPRGRRRWGATFAAGHAGMLVSRSFAAEHRLSARFNGAVIEAALSLRELASLRLAIGATASREIGVTGGDLARVDTIISFAKLAAGLRTPFMTFRGEHGLGAVFGASGGYTLTRVIRAYTSCTTDCPPITTVPLGGGAFVQPEVLLGYGEDGGVHVGLGVAYDRYLFDSRLVDTVEVRLGGGW